MIVNKVYRLLKDTTAPFDIQLKDNAELHIVQDVVYMNGFPLPFEMQTILYNWIINNPTLFRDDTRKF